MGPLLLWSDRAAELPGDKHPQPVIGSSLGPKVRSPR
jgi:hypothetical protein